jgi:AraC family transcriptional regulator
LVHSAQPLINSKAPHLIALEREWRCPPSPEAPLAGGILASRWFDERAVSREVAIIHGADHHTICLALRSASLELEVGGHSTHSGSVSTGMVQISAPAASVNAVLRDPCDFLHFRVPNRLLAARCQELEVCPWDDDRFASDCCFKSDAVITKLTQALLAAQTAMGCLHSGYVDGIASALVTRLVAAPDYGATHVGSRRVYELPKWRLKRAVDYIDAHLAEPIHLGDMAAATGLSRMHFAAQFRASTGCRPREYLLRRRVDQAKTLLSGTDLTLVNIAFSLGFSNQAHFSNVFGRFVGQTPRRWQEANRTINVVVPNRKTEGIQERTARRGPDEFGIKEGANP